MSAAPGVLEERDPQRRRQQQARPPAEVREEEGRGRPTAGRAAAAGTDNRRRTSGGAEEDRQDEEANTGNANANANASTTTPQHQRLLSRAAAFDDDAEDEEEDDDHYNNERSTAEDVRASDLLLSNSAEDVEIDDEEEVVQLEALVVGEPASSFVVPSRQLELREAEMRKTAAAFGLPADRWDGSRLYGAYRQRRRRNGNRTIQQPAVEGDFIEEEGEVSTDCPEGCDDARPPGVVVVKLDPAKYCAEANLSQNFAWSGWMTDMILGYYEDGRLRVPPLLINSNSPQPRTSSYITNWTGDQVLLAFEYMGILYRPDQLEFGNRSAYLAVKHWSSFMTARGELADHVASAACAAKPAAVVDAEKVEGEGDVRQPPSEEISERCFSFAIVPPGCANRTGYRVFETREVNASATWSFFGGDNADMRDDFCSFLHSLNFDRCRLHARFTALPISPTKNAPVHDDFGRQCWILKVHSTDKFAQRRSFRWKSIAATSAAGLLSKEHKDSLPYPLDELVHEELQSGTLERLVQQAKEREQQQKHTHEAPPQLHMCHISDPNDEERGMLNSVDRQKHVHYQRSQVNAGHTASGAESPRDPQVTSNANSAGPAPVTPHLFGAAKKQAVAKQIATLPIVSPSPSSHPPVRVVRASSDSNSVTSALTGPFFEEGGEYRNRRTRRRHLPPSAVPQQRSMYGNALLGHGLSAKGIRALMDDATEVDEPTGSMISSPRFATDEIGAWDWIAGMCEYPRTLLDENSRPSVGGDDGRTDQRITPSRQPQSKSSSLALENVVTSSTSNFVRSIELTTDQMLFNGLCSKPSLSLPRKADIPTTIIAQPLAQKSPTTTAIVSVQRTPFVKDRLVALQQKVAIERQVREDLRGHQGCSDKPGGASASSSAEESPTSTGSTVEDSESTGTSKEVERRDLGCGEVSSNNSTLSIGNSSRNNNEWKRGVRFLFRRRKLLTGDAQAH